MAPVKYVYPQPLPGFLLLLQHLEIQEGGSIYASGRVKRGFGETVQINCCSTSLFISSS